MSSHTPTTFTVEVSGTGRPVIFLPGFACSGSVWDDTVDHLNGRAQSHVVTFAGFAGVPPVAQPSLAGVHAELVRYIGELKSPVIIGHSLGGTMALWLAETVPGLGGIVDVEGLPFLKGAGDPSMTEEQALVEVEPFVAHLRSMTDDQLGAWIRQSMGGMFTRPEDRDRVLNESVRSDVATVAQMWGEGMARDLRAGLSEIAAPVTVVVPVDPSVDAEQHKLRWRTETAAIPDVDLVFLEGRHFVMYDQPDEFNAIVDRVVGVEG